MDLSETPQLVLCRSKGRKTTISSLPPPPNVDVICASVQEHFLQFHVKYLDEKELRMFQTDDVGKDVVELCLECIYLPLYFKNKIKKQ